MAIGALCFATMNVFARMASMSMSWASVAAVRAFVGAGVAAAFAIGRGSSLAAKDRKALFWRSLLGTTSMLLTFYSLSSKTMSLGNTVTLLNLSPVFLAVLAPIFLGERTTPGVAFAILVALGGVLLVVKPDAASFGGSGGINVTVFTAIGAAVATAFAMLLLRRVGRTETPEAIAFHFAIFAAVVHGAIAAFDFHLPSAHTALLMVMAGLCGGLGQIVMTRAYALEHAARVSGMSYLGVVTSAILGALLLGEHPGPAAIVGMALVVCGGVLVSMRRRVVVSRA